MYLIKYSRLIKRMAKTDEWMDGSPDHTELHIKRKGSETVKNHNQNESMSKTKLFGANFMQIGL